jgi:multicomponent Na+:H+ antiporter subunit G
VREAFVIAAAVIGLAFSLSGAVGILRMPDVYSRIQCSSKTITMGALPVLIALVIGEGPISSYGSRALLVGVLLLVVNPAASHALARAAYKTGVPMWSGAVTDEVRGQTGGSPPPGRAPDAGGPGVSGPTAGGPGGSGTAGPRTGEPGRQAGP